MRAFLCALSFAAAVVAQAADSRVTELTGLAKASVAQGDYERATAALASALEIAGTLPDANERIDTAFALARAHEQWAAADPERRREHYGKSLKIYSTLWEQEPRRSDAAAAAWNNCAQIYATLGDDARAASLFEDAVAVDDPMRSFYLGNYGAFLASRGKMGEASVRYELALELAPDDTVIESRLLDLYRDGRVATYLWKLAGRNELDRAGRLALAHLADDLDEAVQRDLLSIVAVALARQHASPEDFALLSERLAPLTERASIAPGVRELRRLYAAAAFDAASYSWWSRVGAERRLPAMDSPLVFSTLACELGRQARKASAEKAEGYFRLAIDVSGALDPEPFILLAELLYSGGRKEDLRAFADAYRDRMMEMKGASYRRGDWRSVYRYHVALGTMYARLGWDGDEVDPRSAIYHFEHARNVAREHGSGQVLDPRSVDLLATSYAKTQPRSEKDLLLRLSVAEEYVQAGRKASAKRVLEPAVADPRAAQGANKVRIERLTIDLPLLQPSPYTPERLKVQTPENVTTEPSTSGRIGRFAAAAATPVDHVAPRRVRVHVLSDLSGTDISAEGLALVLSDYYSAPETMRSDVKTKLDGFGVVQLVDPVEGKGSVVVRQGARTVTIGFEVQ